jgi:hypothetical protein
MHTELEQFTPYPFSAPQAIVPSHGFNQSDGLGRNFGVPSPQVGAPFPVPTKCLPMPAEEGVGLNNIERLFPPMDGAGEEHQEHPIRLGTHPALHLTTESDELLT